MAFVLRLECFFCVCKLGWLKLPMVKKMRYECSRLKSPMVRKGLAKLTNHKVYIIPDRLSKFHADSNILGTSWSHKHCFNMWWKQNHKNVWIHMRDLHGLLANKGSITLHRLAHNKTAQMFLKEQKKKLIHCHLQIWMLGGSRLILLRIRELPAVSAAT